MRRGRGTPRSRARLALALAACVACVLARGVAGDARGAERVAAAPSGRCEAAAGREGLAAAVVGATAIAPESCDARARDARRAGGTDTPPGATEKGRADAEARDRGGPSDDPTKAPGASEALRGERERATRFDENGVVRTEFLRDRYIVRFSEYKMIGAHRAALQAVLGRPSNEKELDPALYGTFLDDATTTPEATSEPLEKIEWAFVERRNKAAAFPTDFAVVAFPPSSKDPTNAEAADVTNRFASRDRRRTSGFETDREPTATTSPSSGDGRRFDPRRLIESAAGVRDVRPEQRFTRALAWDESERGAETNRESGDGGTYGKQNGNGSSSRSRRFNAGAEKETEKETAEDGLRWASNSAPSSRRARRRDERSSLGASHGGGGGASPGRLRTRPTIGMEPEGFEYEDAEETNGRRGYFGGAFPQEAEETAEETASEFGSRNSSSGRRALLRLSRSQSPGVAESMGAGFLWQKGFSGSGVKMGVFDTGVRADHPHFRAVKDRSNWTHEDTLKDGLGHGTFVAGVVASQDPACPGFAPDAEIHTFRVFTNDQVSYTSWFLDAFNYAIASEVHVINLSIGGPDYLDYPFVDKIDEIVANGIVMISAIGNDGPLWGTLNNPADQLDVIGVGGIDFKDQIAPFSSRGMSTHELPHGYGRVKPDVVAYGRDVMGSKIQGGCRSLSGTSVASPVVAGAVTLLASTVPIEKRWDILNPASMKQALVEGATRLEGSGDRSMYAQGAGKLNLVNAFEILRDYAPRASLVPGSLDFENEASCPYAWPHCTQPLYHGAMPFMFNATIVNGMGLGGWLAEPPRFEPNANGDENDLGAHLDFRFDFSETLFPWSGFLAMYVRVKASGAAERGIASGVVVFTVESPPGRGESATRSSRVEVPVRFSVAPTPPRAKRVLWSQFHSVRYPPGYIPRDSLDVKADILDWHGDHPHTNFHGAYDAMRAAGYFVEILGSPLTCFDARSYGALLLVDSEEEFSESEIAKLERDVRENGLGLAVFAEWYNVKQMESMRFFDDNTHSHWTPVVGGGNVPALNDLLKTFGVQLGDRLLKGTAMLKSGEPIVYATGADIAAAPRNAHLHVAHLADHAANEPGAYGTAVPSLDTEKAGKKEAFHVSQKKKPANAEFAVAAFLDETALSGSDPEPPNGVGDDSGGSTERDTGRVAVFGDSNCLDASHSASECFPFLIRTLRFLTEKDDETGLTPRDGSRRASTPYAPYGEDWRPPVRRPDVDFDALSTTRGGHPGNEGRRGACGANDPLEFQDAQLREKTSYAAAGWSRARAERTAETRPKNWRERIGAEAAAELVALGDVFAERRRETAGVAARGSSFPKENGLEGNDGDARDIDAFAKEQAARGAANGARGFPSDELERDAARNRAEHAGDSPGFASERFFGTGFASSGGERPSLSSVVGKRFPTETLTTERAGLAAACLFVCVAAARLRERRRPKRVAKKSAGAASKTSTPAKRGRRLAP